MSVQIKITDHTSVLQGNIQQLYIQVSTTSDVRISRPFISLSWSYSESTNTICFSSPSSPSFFFHLSPRLQLMHLFQGFLLFFKDTHRGHSCRSNHQSPPTLLLLPSTLFYPSLLSFYPLWDLCFLLLQLVSSRHMFPLNSHSSRKKDTCKYI